MTIYDTGVDHPPAPPPPPPRLTPDLQDALRSSQRCSAIAFISSSDTTTRVVTVATPTGAARWMWRLVTGAESAKTASSSMTTVSTADPRPLLTAFSTRPSSARTNDVASTFGAAIGIAREIRQQAVENIICYNIKTDSISLGCLVTNRCRSPSVIHRLQAKWLRAWDTLATMKLWRREVVSSASMAEWVRAWDTSATMKLWRREVASSIPDRGTIVG